MIPRGDAKPTSGSRPTSRSFATSMVPESAPEFFQSLGARLDVALQLLV
jgi:hypothetical protein